MSADDHAAWVEHVRDPATASPGREHWETRADGAHASYQLAPIPHGWAWCANIEKPDGSYSGLPWRGPCDSREAAKEAAVAWLLRRAGEPLGLRTAIEGHASQPDLLGGAW